jgi:sulfur-carrier protein
VNIKYFADIRTLTGREEQKWTKAVPTLRALLMELASQYGAAFEKRTVQEGRLSRSMIILVNGQDVELLNGLETPLRQEDEVVFFPMVAGG